MSHRRPHVRGFTLIEMSMVAMTVAILCAIAVPRYASSLARYYATAAAQRIAADLALAQSAAKTSTKNQIITFSVTGNSYQMIGVVGPDSPAANYSVSLSKPPYQATLVSVSFANATQVTFDRYGMPNSGGTIIVQTGQCQKTITLDVNSGKAVVQ
jgi:Tfp pilus assembly protein FimT